MSDFNYKSRFARTHVDGLAHIHEGAKAFQIQQTSDQKSSSFNSKLPEKALNVFLALILIFALVPIFTPNFKGQQAEADEVVDFGNVSVKAGATIQVAGNKTLSAISDSNGSSVRVVAGQTGANVTEANISTSLNQFASVNYASDAIVPHLSGASLLSESDIRSNGYKISTTDRDYWLSNTGSSGSFAWRSYANSYNQLPNNTLKATGKVDGREYYETAIARGPYAWSKNVTLYDYKGSGGTWDMSTDTYNYLNVYKTDRAWFGTGTKVYNNIHMLESGTDWSGKKYTSTTVRRLETGSDAKLFGYVENGKIYQAMPGDVIKRGTICVFCFIPSCKELNSTANFSGTYMNHTGFLYTQQNFKVINKFVERQPVYGLGPFTGSSGTVSAKQIVADSKAIRPSFNLDTSSIAFFRPYSWKSATYSPTLGVDFRNSATWGTNKAVMRSDAMNLTWSATAANVESDRGAVRIEGSKIIVPYGTKTLKIKNLNRTGGNCVSALAKANGILKYGQLGDGSDVTLDLTNLLQNKITGATTQISLFAENNNGTGTSDAISKTPVSLTIEVGVGEPHSLTYDADGGSGVTLPAAMQVKAGSSVVLANGSSLQKGGNMFSRWVATYVDDGAKVNLILNPGESFLMPDSDVVIVAQYSGLQIAKSSVTEGATNFIVTFDLNGGTMNGYSTSRIPIKVKKGAKIGNPFSSDPVKGEDKFIGWYTSAEGGNKVDLSSQIANSNLTLYAHYSKYDLPTDYGGGDVFLAPKSVNPYDVIKGKNSDAISIATVKSAASQLSKGINLAPEILNAQNDEWHLFAKISGTGSSANDWLECRIIHTGQHDGDGSGLTFQAVHALPSRYKWDTNWSSGQKAPNWANCTLRSTMNGSIFRSLPTGLQNAILPIAKKYNTTAGSSPNGGNSATVTDKLWLISTTELVSNVAGKKPSYWNNNSHQGSTYAFWNSKNLVIGAIPVVKSEQWSLLYPMNCNRAGSLLKEPSEAGGALGRSVSPGLSDIVLGFIYNGMVNFVYGLNPSLLNFISPSFAM